MSMNRVELHKGASDILGICDALTPSTALLRDFIIAQGDTIVHFSSEATEHSLSKRVPRWLVLTDKSVYCIPKSSVETGIFFESRTDLGQIAQLIVSDTEGGPEVNLLQRSPVTGDAALVHTLTLPNSSVRKTFLLAFCIARPAVPILQRRKLESSVVPQSEDHSPSTKAKNISQSQSNLEHGFLSPPKKATRSDADLCSPAPKIPFSTPEPLYDIADDVFSASRDRLRDILCDTWGDDTYDAEKTASRPREEDPSRASERENIKAMLDHLEKKISQNIEFKLKYPTKAPMKVAPGVEYDKAHEERMALPDDIKDDELLGPALFPDWLCWKQSGGLLGKNGVMSDWALQDSMNLINALREKENELFGFVGPRCLRKVRSMRELVTREMFLYKNKEKDVRISLDRSMSPKARLTFTKPRPFSLSQSQYVSVKAHLKVLEKHSVISEMKAKYEDHVRAKHELKKQQYQRELDRLSPAK